MRISPLDHGKVPSGLELSSKPHATGMSYDPLQKFSRGTRPVDFFVCCPIELGKAKRLAVLSGKVVEAVEHSKLHLSVGVIWRREHVCPAHIHPLRPWPVVRPVGLCCSTYQDVPYEQQIVVACHTLGGTKCRLPPGCPIALSLLSTSPPLRMVAHRRQNLGMYSGPPQPLLKDGQLNSCNILTGTTWPVLSVHDFRCCATFITYSSGSMPAAVGAPLHRSRKEYSGSLDRTSRLRNKCTASVLAAFKISWSYQS